MSAVGVRETRLKHGGAQWVKPATQVKAYTRDKNAKHYYGGRFFYLESHSKMILTRLTSEMGKVGSVGFASCECVLRPPLLTLPERS